MPDPTVQDVSWIQTITDTTNIIYDVSGIIDFLSPFDVPLLQRIGMTSLHTPCTQVKHEWLEDALVPQQTVLDGAYTAGTGTLTVAAGTGLYFYTDDLILVGNNVLRILVISTDTFTVVGGIGGSTDAAAVNASIVYRLGQASKEASVARVDTKKTTLVRPYNYTQILRDWVVVSGTMEVINRIGYASERSYQEEKVLKRMYISMEKTLLYGRRSYSAVANERRSTLGGLAEYILDAGIAGSWDTVVNAAGGEFTETMLNNMMQQVFEAGGTPSLLVLNGFNQRKVTSWGTPRIRTDIGTGVAGATIGQYVSDFGVLDILLDRNLRPSDVLFLSPEDIGIGPLTGRQFQSKMLPSLGDYTQSELLGEYTAEVHRPAMAHGWIYGTATS